MLKQARILSKSFCCKKWFVNICRLGQHMDCCNIWKISNVTNLSQCIELILLRLIPASPFAL